MGEEELSGRKRQNRVELELAPISHTRLLIPVKQIAPIRSKRMLIRPLFVLILAVFVFGRTLPALCQIHSAAFLDRYGGLKRVVGQATGTFHLQKIEDRWWLVTPEGHGLFVRAVSKVDVADYGGSGGFLSYDAVYLQAAGAISANLKEAAADTALRDVVHPQTGVTLQAKGDALYLGSARFKPDHTCFWLDRLAVGGKLQWFYSTSNGWKLIRETGNPSQGAALTTDGGYNLDIGNYMAPDRDGFGAWENHSANRITWWDMAQGFPADFAPLALPGDPTPRYYIKAVVTRDFMVPPILNQVYERDELPEAIAKKYSPGDVYGKWALAITQRLKSWGFNAAGQYSGRYVALAPKLAERLPVEPTWQLSWSDSKNADYQAKNVYAGAVFPPGSSTLLYQGVQVDVFEPGYAKAVKARATRQQLPTRAWSWALIPEEADYLFGINKRTHDHLGYVVLSQNPYRAQDATNKTTYTDPRFYARYALRDFLRDRYRTAQEKRTAYYTPESTVPFFTYSAAPSGAELAALQKLNAAWGTYYTTWGTAFGDLLKGTNAFGAGSGFMDENGKSVLAPGVRSIGFDQPFLDLMHPAIRRDLDAFVGFFAARYGRLLAKALAPIPHPPLLLPLYDAPDVVYQAVAPYVDGFWVNVREPQDALRIYNAGHKPLLVADYLTSDPDSPLFYRGTIASLTYDPATGNSRIIAPDFRYPFRLSYFITFPEAAQLQQTQRSGGKYLYPYPRVKSVQGHTLEVPGDFTASLQPGMRIERWKEGGYPLRTQEDRARALIRRYDALLHLKGDDGVGFVLGIEHWCLYDPSVNNWVDSENFGLCTLQDNAYDGIEAKRKAGNDTNGYPVGGEEADYGNLLGPLGDYLRRMDALLQTEAAKPKMR
jgi:hypothetical protein